MEPFFMGEYSIVDIINQLVEDKKALVHEHDAMVLDLMYSKQELDENVDEIKDLTAKLSNLRDTVMKMGKKIEDIELENSYLLDKIDDLQADNSQTPEFKLPYDEQEEDYFKIPLDGIMEIDYNRVLAENAELVKQVDKLKLGNEQMRALAFDETCIRNVESEEQKQLRDQIEGVVDEIRAVKELSKIHQLGSADMIHLLCDQIDELRAEKTFVYAERNKLVGLLSKVFPSFICIDEEGVEFWQNVVILALPTGQASFHVHTSELPLFGHLKVLEQNIYDGHSTVQKYARVDAMPVIETIRFVNTTGE
jgi:hypothetical protein